MISTAAATNTQAALIKILLVIIIFTLGIKFLLPVNYILFLLHSYHGYVKFLHIKFHLQLFTIKEDRETVTITAPGQWLKETRTQETNLSLKLKELADTGRYCILLQFVR